MLGRPLSFRFQKDAVDRDAWSLLPLPVVWIRVYAERVAEISVIRDVAELVWEVVEALALNALEKRFDGQPIELLNGAVGALRVFCRDDTPAFDADSVGPASGLREGVADNHGSVPCGIGRAPECERRFVGGHGLAHVCESRIAKEKDCCDDKDGEEDCGQREGNSDVHNLRLPARRAHRAQ